LDRATTSREHSRAKRCRHSCTRTLPSSAKRVGSGLSHLRMNVGGLPEKLEERHDLSDRLAVQVAHRADRPLTRNIHSSASEAGEGGRAQGAA
jgi:hypothetical protein